MAVLRIVANLEAADPGPVKRFYAELFGLETLMDLGWFTTLGSQAKATVQIGIGSEGGSGTPVPNLSIEVDSVDEVYAAARAAGHEIVYGPADEPWGVRRFYVRDPLGNIVNVLSHK
jgi:predicted enzyme related to lactoylglutathione lyase